MPPTRREQLQLDELLSDIYRGIETLPDKSAADSGNYGNHSAASNKSPSGAHISSSYARSHVQEYELPASSPLVRHHKQELAALRAANAYSPSASSPSGNLKQPQPQPQPQPQRSTLKRQPQATPDQRPPQSLASFISSPATPESKRRVRIVDHPDKLAKGYNSDDYADDNTDQLYPDQQHSRGPTARSGNSSSSNNNNNKVKYVNTNKLIYHQERDPDDASDSDEHSNQHNPDDDDDIDGVTRVEYYHTTWLDRQLGRASKRRSSKELNERQVKEKAMIEELKRSLKNGAITLRQSFKGNKHKNKSSEIFDDDHRLNSQPDRYSKSSSVFGSGLATIPRNYNSNNSTNNNWAPSNRTKHNKHSSAPKHQQQPPSKAQQQQKPSKQYDYRETNSSNTLPATPKQTNTFDSVYSSAPKDYTLDLNQSSVASQPMQTRHQESQSNYTRTLPHNYSQQKKSEHQLLQTHYRGSKSPRPTASSEIGASNVNSSDIMRNPNYTSNCVNTKSNTLGPIKSPSQYPYHQQQQLAQQRQVTGGETISSIPSATEVVRSALSRSNSQTSLNQLNKTINLLPTSPSPYHPSPMTPTQTLKAATPSLSPSPIGSPNMRQHCPSPHYSSKTIGSTPSRQQPQQQLIRVTGTRTIDRPTPTIGQPQQQQQPQQQPQQQQPFYQQQLQQQQLSQPVYANPHASLMQHRIEQQMRQPNRNQASIREFNELDSLLRSLGPGSTTHVAPGYSSKPSQPAFGGYGYTPVQQPTATQPRQNVSDVYAKVQKSPAQQPQPQQQPHHQQQQYGANIHTSTTHQPFTIDVTNKKDDECLQRQNLSEFEPPIELLPSMEDYQNISKLNPVRNHYWYKPNMSRDRAINLLKDKPQGTFIVRDSTSFKGAFGLAVKVSKLPKNVLNNASLRNPHGDPSAELIRHFLIEPVGNGCRLKGYSNEPVFSSLANLIYQHSLTELALPCKLAIPRADIEDPKFNQKQKQFYDDFLASKELAKHNPYDRTSPNGGYRRYPGDVLVHNEHRIIFE